MTIFVTRFTISCCKQSNIKDTWTWCSYVKSDLCSTFGTYDNYINIRQYNSGQSHS